MKRWLPSGPGLSLVILWVLVWLMPATRAEARPTPEDPGVPALVPAEGGDRYYAYTSPGDLPALKLADGTGALPLRHTAVTMEVTGFVARVQVTQTYRNDADVPIEAVYTFPLPENSAVDDMRIVIGDRTISADIETRDQARRIYQQARAAGQTTALLEQERANIFTQQVANIAPHEDIDVVIRYVQPLTYDAGQYELVFPMVVGPRFVDDRVPDAARVTPPVAGPGTRTGHDIALSVQVDAGLPIQGFTVPTHRVTGGLAANGTLSLALANKTTIPNRDFVLRYGVAGRAVTPTLLLDGDDTGGHFTLIVQPPDVDVDALVGARELLFVMDVSGSMHGVPLSICKVVMREAIMRLRPVDTFNIVTFAGRTGLAFDEPRPANDHNVREALAFVSGLRAGGSTQILDAVDLALRRDVGQGRHRYVFFLTDGYVSIEDDVHVRTRQWVEHLARRGQRARVFSLGVGSSPNRALLETLADAGRGLASYVGTREDPRAVVGRYYAKIDHPIWTDLSIDWDGAGMRVADVHPAEPPDLFASRPVILHGRYTGAPASSVELSARHGKTRVRTAAPARRARVGADVVPTLWARARVADLQIQHALHADERFVAEITQLGLDHRLVTPYTSFVAVDRTRTVGDGDPTRIDQPVEGPEGVDLEAAGARMERRIAMSSSVESLAFEADMYDAPAPSPMAADEADYAYRRRAAAGGCAHCGGGRRDRDLATLLLPLGLLGLRRRRRRSTDAPKG
ncbi:MAG: VIT domain-containing protein [Myxococcota bacterium]